MSRYEEALAALQNTLRLTPENVRAHCCKGQILFILKKYEGAVLACDEALRLEPDNSNAHHGKALSLYGLKKYEDALDEINKAVTLEPQNHIFYNNKGAILDKAGNKDEALISLEKSLDCHKENSAVYYNKASLLNSIGLKKKALSLLKKANEFSAINKAPFYNKQVSILSDLRLYQEALAVLEEYTVWNSCHRKEDAHELEKKSTDAHSLYLAFVGEENKDHAALNALWEKQFEIMALLQESPADTVACHTTVEHLEQMLPPSSLPFTLTNGLSSEQSLIYSILNTATTPIERQTGSPVTVQASFSGKLCSSSPSEAAKENTSQQESVTLLFNREFFKQEEHSHILLMEKCGSSSSLDNETPLSLLDAPEVREDQQEKLPLYSVLYYNKEESGLYYPPADLRISTCLGESQEAPSSPLSRNPGCAKIKLEAISKTLRELKELFHELDEALHPKALALLTPLSLLIQNASQKDSREFKLIDIRHKNDPVLKTDSARRALFTDYQSITDKNSPLAGIITSGDMEKDSQFIDYWGKLISDHNPDMNITFKTSRCFYT